MGAIWSAAAVIPVLIAGLWSIASGHSRGSPAVYVVEGMLRWIPIAFGAGTLFALLVILAGRRGARNFAPWRGAIAGAVVGMTIITVLVPRSADGMMVAAATALIGLIGASIGSGILWVARRGQSRTELLSAFRRSGALTEGLPDATVTARTAHDINVRTHHP